MPTSRTGKKGQALQPSCVGKTKFASPVKKTSLKSKAAGGVHRQCCRCHRRADKCLESGCLPFEFRPRAGALRAFRDWRTDTTNAFRFCTDVVDVRCIACWGSRAAVKNGIELTLLGVCMHAHFNSIRTSGVLLPALETSAAVQPRWASIQKAMRFCGVTWGHGGTHPTLGLYTSNNMPGSGFPRRPGQGRIESIVEGSEGPRALTPGRTSGGYGWAGGNRIRRPFPPAAPIHQ